MNEFIVKDEYSFELYPYIKESVILSSFQEEIKAFNLPTEVSDILLEAWNSRFWITLGYDSASIVQDMRHPNISAFFHDYFYRSGFATRYKDGKKVDYIYKAMLKLTGSSNYTAVKRYSLIRVFGSIFRVRHKLRGNKKNPSIEMINLYNKLKG